MPNRILYCRYEDCGKPDESVAGEQKALCPACRREAKWATEPGHPVKATEPPRGVLDLTFNDRRFLKQLRIGQE